MKKILAYLISGKIFSNTTEAVNLFSTRKFGEKSGEKVYYSRSEALYLVEKNQMKILDHRDQELSTDKINKKFERLDKDFKTKFIVFKDLRNLGYIVKTALKFGSVFRVYERKTSKHSKWILFPVEETKNLSWQDFAAKNRVANNAKKNLLIAVTDEENNVSYFEVKWTKP
ncbi:MAG: tRNA-intron lyase [Nanoarchaeota archaeon]|nr:tRNA-intron lyase [Nanoarchaeota archaeon]